MALPGDDAEPEGDAKIVSQNSKSMRYAGRPVARCSASSTVSHAASPIVNDGKMMWKETVKANCSRDRTNAERSIVRPYRHNLNGLHSNTRKVSVVTGGEKHLFAAHR
jgi:hypothetical protein